MEEEERIFGCTRDSYVKGEKEMNGHVFQTNSEQKNRDQFQDTLDALKVYSSKIYRKNITSKSLI